MAARTYQLIADLADRILAGGSQVMAADGFPGLQDGEPMLETCKLGKGKNYLEVNKTTPEAETAFDWRYEITVSTEASYRHFLLRKGGDIVETYGKQIIDSDQDSQQTLVKQLQARLKS